MPLLPQAARLKKVAARDLVALDHVRGRMATVWLAGASLVLIIVVMQSLLGKFGDRTQEAWGWLLPNIMPTLSMIVTVLGYSALDPEYSAGVVRKSFFRTALYLSALYLALVLLTILIHPFSDVPPVDLMNQSSLWLGPFQALTASAVGVLFVSKQSRPEGPDSP
jgi:hypothetical protein